MERMTRLAAARALGINKSTLTRWVQKHPALVGDDGLFDLAELRIHRDSVVNPKLQTRGGVAKPPSTEASAGNGAATMNEHRVRGEAAKAITAELDLAERLKMTLVRDDVEFQISQAGFNLRRIANWMAKDRAEALARIDDPRAMERALDELFRDLLNKGADQLMLAIQEDADAAADRHREPDAA